MMGLTKRQRELLRVIYSWYEREGRPPTYREMGKAMGCVHSAIQHFVYTMERKGFVRIGQGEGSRNKGAVRLRGVRVLFEIEDTDAGRQLAAELAKDGVVA